VSQPVQNLVMAMIAKKPEDRPASAAAVARAATALRRGDLAAAAAAVPAIAAGAAATDAATQLLTAGGTAAATQLLPATAAVATTEETEEPKKKRSPWTWPLIALIALLVIVLVGTVWALVANQNAGPTPTSGSPSASQSDSPSPSPSYVDVTALNLVGMKCTDAVQVATQQGLKPAQQPGSAATSADQVGTVQSTNPSAGNVPAGSAITITCYADQASIPAPDNPTVDGNSAGNVTAGATVNVAWNAYTCPAGYTLTGYTVNSAVGDSTTNTRFGAAATNGTLTVPNSPGQTWQLSMTASCSQNGQDRTSAASSGVSFLIQPSSTPEPEPDSSPTP
jgi:eukaryotic-like serine/threonine-protein kinase